MSRRKGDPLKVVATEHQRLLVEQERLRIAVSDHIANEMERKDIRAADLSKALGMTAGNLSQILGGDRNLTLRTMALIGWALGCRWQPELRPVEMASADASSQVRFEKPTWQTRGGPGAEVSEPADLSDTFDVLSPALTPTTAPAAPTACGGAPWGSAREDWARSDK